MLNFRQEITIALMIFTLSGCGVFHNPKDAPIDFSTISPARPTVVVMTPERRSVLIVPQAYNGQNIGLRVCPEPPPDVAEALTDALAAQLKAENSDIHASSKFSSSFTSSITQLFRRSQGAELFRDGSNALCLAWLNDIYKHGDLDTWRTDFNHLLELSTHLIQLEITAHAQQNDSTK